jgi:hypothetical protein
METFDPSASQEPPFSHARPFEQSLRPAQNETSEGTEAVGRLTMSNPGLQLELPVSHSNFTPRTVTPRVSLYIVMPDATLEENTVACLR